MPAPISRSGRARALTALLASIAFASGAAAQTTTDPVGVPDPAPVLTPAPVPAPAAAASAAAAPPENSGLDARLFYQLLVGEIELRSGEAGTAYQVLLDAARRTGSEQVFRRATEIALQARAGEQALAAVLAWRSALPESTEALRYQVQLLLALNRAGDSLEPLSELLRLTAAPERPALIDSLPRFFARSADRTAAAELLARALAPYLDEPGTRVSSGVALGRSWLAAHDTDKALDFVRRAHAAAPDAQGPALLALEMLPGTPGAEAVVTGYLAAKPTDTRLRLLYVRSLAGSQRYAEATAQLETLTRAEPQLAQSWLTLGAVQLEMHHPVEATAALKQYVQLVEGGAAAGAANRASAPDTAEPAADDDAPATPSEGLTQAWLLLAQAAEQQRDYAAAEGWLARIDDPQKALDVQLRRASILAGQGRLDEARASIRRVPEQTATDARAKLLAEAQLLRDQKAWGEAAQVLAEANTRFPDDADLLYEQAMMDEKLDRLDEMERLLRRVIALKPNHHNAYNALGYSLAERKLRLPEARELIVKALELSPGEPFITDSLGWVEYRLGNRDEALRLLRDAYRSRPDPEIAAHLGEVLWVAGQADEALRVWREGRSRDSANEVLKETLARLRVKL